MNPAVRPTLAPPALEKLLTHHPLTAAAVLGTLLLGACASSPVPSQALLQAREAVQAASVDRDVQTHATLELKKARDTLDGANGMLGSGAEAADVDSRAYVAERQARTAQAVGRAKQHDAGIAAAELDRERMRADMRTRQAERAMARAGSAQADASLARQQAASADQRAQGAEVRASGAEQRATGAEQRATQAERDAGQAQQQAAVAQASATESRQQTADLQQRLTDLQARPTDRGMLVTLGDVLFETNRADIRPGSQADLRKLADFMREYPQRSLLIEGHTDSQGTAAANEVLSRRRAQAVDAALIGLGVASSRMTTTGYGKDFPVADNNTADNRALNRRVEVYISDVGQSVRQRR